MRFNVCSVKLHIIALLRCSLVVTAVALLRSFLRSALLRSALLRSALLRSSLNEPIGQIRKNYSKHSILDYRIEFEEDVYSPGVWKTLKNYIAGFERVIQVGVSPGVNYRFRIFARNSVGWSENATTTETRYKTPDSGKKCDH